jgi:conjugal transfer ATP-binding protein TraC
VDNLRLNPFSTVTDISRSAESIRDLIAVMASPTQGLNDVQKAHLLDAVNAAYKKNKNKANIDDVIEYLQSIDFSERNMGFDLRVDDLVTLLKKYSLKYAPEGSLAARIFNDPSQLQSDNPENERLIVLELGKLEKQPDLLKSVLFALILHIEEKMYHDKSNRKKICVIDEAWRLLSGSNETAASFIEKGYRTSRKYNACFATVTQQIGDFYASSEAQAAWSCAETKIIMRQNEKAFKDFLVKNPDYFDSYQQTLIKSFRPSAISGFSEFMLIQGSTSSFHRLFLDPIARNM